MPIELDFSGDFSQVVDGTQAVTLKRREGDSVSIAQAWRFETATVEAEPSDGRVATTDTVWQFEWPSELAPLRLGDRLIDTAGDCANVIRIEQAGNNTRWRVTTRRLAIAWGLDRLVAIEQAEWDEGDPPALLGWSVVDPAVPAHIEPQTLTADLTTVPPTHAQSFRVTIDTPLALDGNYRLVTADGTTYRVREFTDAARIDALPVALVVLA